MILKRFIPPGYLLAFMLVFYCPGNTKAQEIQFPAYTGYNVELNYPVYTPDNLWDYINGAAESYISLGFNELYIAEYTKGRKVKIKVEVYSHLSPLYAFGIYALERSPTYSFVDLGVQGYEEEGLVHFTKGNYYVKVMTHSKSKKALSSVNGIAGVIEQSLEGTITAPEVLSLFPLEGRLPNEEMYISESVLGHEFLRNAFRANYRLGDNDFTIYIFNPVNEEVNREMLDKYLGKHGLAAGDSADGKFSFKDGYNGDIFLAWRSDLAVLITGLNENDASVANEYLNKILK